MDLIRFHSVVRVAKAATETETAVSTKDPTAKLAHASSSSKSEAYPLISTSSSVTQDRGLLKQYPAKEVRRANESAHI